MNLTPHNWEKPLLEPAYAHCERVTAIRSRSFSLGARLLIVHTYLSAFLALRSRTRRA